MLPYDLSIKKVEMIFDINENKRIWWIGNSSADPDNYHETKIDSGSYQYIIWLLDSVMPIVYKVVAAD